MTRTSLSNLDSTIYKIKIMVNVDDINTLWADYM